MATMDLLLPLVLLLLVATPAHGEYGVVHVVSGKGSKDYCALFSSEYVTLPRDLHHAPLLPLHDGTKAPWCPSENTYQSSPQGTNPQKPLSKTTAMVLRGNCSFYAKGRLAQGQGAYGLLIVSRAGDLQCSDTTPLPVTYQSQGLLPDLTIPVAVLRYDDMLDILNQARGRAIPRVAMYVPLEPVLDYNMVIIFILAVGTVAVGGYWAGMSEAERLQRRRERRGGAANISEEAEGVAEEEEEEEEPVDFTPAMTGAVVLMSCSIMLLLYFFYDCFVYIMIGVFGLGAGTGLYSCLSPLARRLPLGHYQLILPGLQTYLQLSLILLAGLCTSITAIWMIFRNEERWAWFLQDTLGVAYCLFVLRRVRLPTLRSCASFLLALLAFDVFFVFITPFLTRTGESIMVEVASGPSDSTSHEKLPMVLKVPRLSFSPLTLCDRPFSILGFGDIVVPGFLVAYCHRFDIQVRSSRVYYMTCTLAYAVGLLVTFLAMILMQMGQPALLYLVSCTLITSLGVAVCRQELSLFWTGQGFVKPPTHPVIQSPPSPDNRMMAEEPSPSPEQKSEEHTDIQPIVKTKELNEEGASLLESSLTGDSEETLLPAEDGGTSPCCLTDSSEGWSDANLDPEELPTPPLGTNENPGTPGTQVGELNDAPEDTVAWTGLHKRKGLKVKKSLSAQASL
ncbi:signal peptide peptidase-like 2C [Monodelphis domestica]|uniref:signal peptide peptidase-like 2C n=1 Tax=Monodelphis domestica TaxID=13616 RepID=UPI00020F604D|nr:signal peptide peptidase-like 2C [Monodelphis domestica]